jgi:hypothetical protein
MIRLFAVASMVLVSSVAMQARAPASILDHSSSIAPIFAQVSDTYDFEIITIPALAGVNVTLDGVTRRTNVLGRASFSVRRINGEVDPRVAGRVIVETNELEIDDRTIARFARPVERARSLTLMYSTYHQTAFSFVDANDRRIANSRIESTIIKSSTGEALEIDVNDDVWLLGTRVAGSARPEVKPVFWTINDVIIDGTSVAHRGQTKFYPDTDALVSSGLLLFDVRFRTVDAFFGFPAGDRLTITTPSEEIIDLELVDGIASIEQLPRGEYEVVIEGSGLRIGRPVTLTRNQDLRLLYYSRLDIALVAIGLAGFLVLPFVIGLRRHRSREAPVNTSGSEPTGVEDQPSVESSRARVRQLFRDTWDTVTVRLSPKQGNREEQSDEAERGRT